MQWQEKREKAFCLLPKHLNTMGKMFTLKLEEQIEGTSQFKIYKSITYRMLIAFSSEFDDF
jgi:hypothetical protein